MKIACLSPFRKVGGAARDGLLRGGHEIIGIASGQGDQAWRYTGETFDSDAYGRDLVAFAKSIRHERIVLELAHRVAHMVREIAVDPAIPTMLDRVSGEIALTAEDRPRPDPFGRRTVSTAVARHALGLLRGTKR